LLAALRTHFFKREKKKGKKRKEKALEKAGGGRLSRFLEKILPEGWRFFSKPVGLDLDCPKVRLACANPPIFAFLFLKFSLYE
tara:strand:- start:640 stop:888 length:249 start_codon:yes stop_codon:yes gene_type:complete